MLRFLVIFTAVLVTACNPIGRLQGPPVGHTASQYFYVGGIGAAQNPVSDRLARGQNANQYGLALFRCLKKQRCKPMGGQATLSLRDDQGKVLVGSLGPMQVELTNIQAKGWQYVRFPIADLQVVRPGTLLCIEMQKPIAHQVSVPHFAQPGQHIMCSEAIYSWFVQDGRGRREDDAWGAAAIEAAG